MTVNGFDRKCTRKGEAALYHHLKMLLADGGSKERRHLQGGCFSEFPNSFKKPTTRIKLWNVGALGYHEQQSCGSAEELKHIFQKVGQASHFQLDELEQGCPTPSSSIQ